MIITKKTDLQFEITNIVDSEGNPIRLKDCNNFVAKFYTTNIHDCALSVKLNEELTNIKIEEDRDLCVINATDLGKMLDGVLFFNIEYGVPDEAYQDGIYNNNVNGNTNFYIRLGNTEEEDVDLSNYYTKDEVDTLIDEVVAGTIDLSDYYTKEEVDNLFTDNKVVNEDDLTATLLDYATIEYVDESLANKVDSNTYNSDKATFATKEEVGKKQDTLISGENLKTINSQSLLGEGNIEITVEGGGITDAPSDGKTYGRKDNQWSEVVIPDVSNLASKSELANKLDSSAYTQDKSTFALKSEIPTDYLTDEDIANLATKEELGNKVDSSAYTTDKATFALKSETYSKSEVDSKIDEAITGGEVDLSNYYTKTDSDSRYVAKEEGKVLSSNDYTNEDKEKLAGLSNYNDTELKSQLANKLDVTAATATYQPKGEYLTAIPDEYVTDTELTGKGYITNAALTNYALKSELPTDYVTDSELEGYATTTQLASKQDTLTQGSNITISGTTISVSDELVGRISSIETEIAGANDLITEIKGLI